MVYSTRFLILFFSFFSFAYYILLFKPGKAPVTQVAGVFLLMGNLG